MTFSVDYVDAVPLKRRSTKKKQWNDVTNEWQDVTVWTVAATRELAAWLQKEYPGFEGWSYTWTDTKITMEEKIYVFACLKFKNL